MKVKTKKRFQECNKLEKLWRYRFYLYIPFKYVYHVLLSNFKVYIDKINDKGKIENINEYKIYKGKNLWKLLVGIAQTDMNWYYTMEEVQENLKKLKESKKGFNSSPPKSFIKKFQIRFNEPLGKNSCPYAYRWVLITPWFSIRVHHFLRSDDKRYFHDHAWDFWTFILKGYYWDVSPYNWNLKNKASNEMLITRIKRKAGKLYKVPAEHRHYVEIPKKGCWTLVFCKKPRRKWGFWVGEKFRRPLKYFHKFGHLPCDEQ